MTKDDLLALSERIEAASGPDRYLDSYIWAAVGGADNAGTPLYTASLDAALTLVPEGYEWGAGSFGNPDTEGPWAWCATKQQSADNDLDYGKAGTPALALCAASLRARANQEPNNG